MCMIRRMFVCLLWVLVNITCFASGDAKDCFQRGDCELFVVGDSHALFFAQSGIMKSHWTGPIHVATIYQLLKWGLNFYNLQEELAVSAHYVNIGSNPWQCPSGKYDVPNIKSGDWFFFLLDLIRKLS